MQNERWGGKREKNERPLPYHISRAWSIEGREGVRTGTSKREIGGSFKREGKVERKLQVSVVIAARE